jgi:hypothetical protein
MKEGETLSVREEYAPVIDPYNTYGVDALKAHIISIRHRFPTKKKNGTIFDVPD